LDLLKRLGVDVSEMPAVPAISLGTVDMSVYEMVAAFSAFANKGVYIEPIMVRRITDNNGTILYLNHPQTNDAMSAETAYVTVKLMEGVTTSGTGQRLTRQYDIDSPLYNQVMTGYPYGFTNPIA